MANDLGVFVVLNQMTGLWDAGCCNDMCGYGGHNVSDDNSSKTAAEKAATEHRKHIRDLFDEREKRNADLNRIDWEARAIKAEALIERVRAQHPPDDSNARGLWCGTCLTVWPCRTIRALGSTHG